MLIFPNICYELGKIELRQRFNQINIERKLLSSMIKKYGIYILLELSELMNWINTYINSRNAYIILVSAYYTMSLLFANSFW